MLYVATGLFFFSSLTLSSENAVEVDTKDGQKVYFRLADHPFVTFSGDGLVVNSRTESVSFLISDCVKMQVRDIDFTGIHDVNREAGAVFRLLTDRLEVSGLKKGVPVMLYAINGRLMYGGQTGNDGCLVVDLSSFEKGTYVVKAGSVACKIMIP